VLSGRLSVTRLLLSIVFIAITAGTVPGFAFAAAFSTGVSPFPGGGVYIPTVNGSDDDAFLIYEALTLPGVLATPVAPGIIQYDFNALLSPTADPDAAFAVGIGTMFSIEGPAGVFTTCWSYGCSPDPDNLFSFFEAFAGGVVSLFRADPDGAQDDPGRQSTGTMTAIPVAGGYEITSFFDLFIEIYDAGEDAWSNAGSIRSELFGDPVAIPAIPEPGTFVLKGSGLSVAARAWRVRRRRRTA
jgi:hypothetical protein